jgi:hypothetical protein
MRADDVTISERIAIAVVDAIIVVPLSALAAWRHGRERLIEAGVVSLREARAASASAVEPDTRRAENVVDYVRAFEAHHGHKPKVAEVQQRFNLSRTTAWRRIRSA